MDILQSAVALARPVPIPGRRGVARRRRPREHDQAEIAKSVRRALFSGANVLLSGDTTHVDRYVRSVLEREIIGIDAGGESPLGAVEEGLRSEGPGPATILIRNVERLDSFDQLRLLDLLEGENDSRSAARGFRLISTTKSARELESARAGFLPSLLLRIGTMTIEVPGGFFETMSSRRRTFSIAERPVPSSLEVARA